MPHYAVGRVKKAMRLVREFDRATDDDNIRDSGSIRAQDYRAVDKVRKQLAQRRIDPASAVRKLRGVFKEIHHQAWYPRAKDRFEGLAEEADYTLQEIEGDLK